MEYNLTVKFPKWMYVFFFGFGIASVLIGMSDSEILGIILGVLLIVIGIYTLIIEVSKKSVIVINSNGFNFNLCGVKTIEWNKIYQVDIVGKKRDKTLIIRYDRNGKITKMHLTGIYSEPLERIHELLVEFKDKSSEVSDFSSTKNYSKIKENIYYQEHNIIKSMLPFYNLFILFLAWVAGNQLDFPSYSIYIFIGFLIIGFIITLITQLKKTEFKYVIRIHAALLMISTAYFLFLELSSFFAN